MLLIAYSYVNRNKEVPNNIYIYLKKIFNPMHLMVYYAYTFYFKNFNDLQSYEMIFIADCI